MTIAEKLLRTKDDFDAVYEAGRKSVGEVLKFTDVSSNAYRSTVPNGVEPFARVDKIGGMTYKSNNLLPYPYPNTTKTENGITFTDNGDGTITANGTATADTKFGCSRFTVKAGQDYFISGCPAGGSATTYYLHLRGFNYDVGNGSLIRLDSKDFTNNVEIVIKSGTTVSNLTFKPMLNEGTTALPYEPYFEGLRSASVSELKSEGANLFEYPYYSKTLTSAGITFTDNGDGSITINGTNDGTGNSAFFIYHDTKPTHLPAGTYTASAFGSNGEIFGSIQFIAYGFGSWVNMENSASFDKDVSCGIYIQIPDWQTAVYDNVTIYPMLNIGSIALPYKPYIGTIDTLAIPEAVQSLDGYGLGLNTEYYNYIDFERKVIKAPCKKFLIDGSIGTYVTSPFENAWYIVVSTLGYSDRIITGLADKYNRLTTDELYAGGKDGIYLSNTSEIFIIDSRFTDAATAKAILSESPIECVCAFNSESETDISAYLTDEYIEVEGGGTITAVNEYEYDVPTNISYLTDTQGG